VRRTDLSSSLTRARRLFGDRTFVHFEGHSITYSAFDERVSRLAQAFRRLGLVDGDRIAVVMTNRPEWMECLFAAVRAGGVLVPINRRLTSAEMVTIVASANARFVVTEASFEEFTQAASQLDSVHTTLLVGDRAPEGAPAGLRMYEPEISKSDAQQAPHTVIDDDAVQAIHFTSGTTGAGKGVMRSHGANTAMALGSVARLPVNRDDTWFYAIPVHSAGFYALALPAMYRGARVLLTRDFDPEQSLALMAQEHVTHAMFVPTMWEMLLRADGRDRYELSSLRHAVWGGMPISTVTAKNLAQWLPVPCVGGYGQTEATCATWSDATIFDDGRVESSGRPIETMELRVVDGDGNDLPAGEYGEVWMRGALVMNGYLDKPELTAEVLRPDGWLKTGDWGRLDADGVITVIDRIKDMIITGGENVYCIEVENIIAQVAGVREVAVLGMPHPLWGQSVAAVVVADGPVTAAEIDQFCVTHLAGFKRPKHIVFVDELPKNSLGKITKNQLATVVAGEVTAQ
jgi:acyl-CoA synthetase (AMP-forming)/AMP-acid ligase II